MFCLDSNLGNDYIACLWNYTKPDVNPAELHVNGTLPLYRFACGSFLRINIAKLLSIIARMQEATYV